MTPQEREDREVLRELAEGYRSMKWVINTIYRLSLQITAVGAACGTLGLAIRWMIGG
jgi:hypothetical protein